MQPEPSIGPTPAAGRTRLVAVTAAVALAMVVGLGVVLRLADPLSSPVVPAEDPYTHMALVREHLRTGGLDPLNAHETVYPPGLHGFLAAVHVLTGADLYDLTLFGPVALGAIGILGVGLLLWRMASPVAGVVGALAVAVAPEAIFRSTMMSPTALDLAILPFLLYALLRIVDGRIAWAGVAAPMAVFLALAHPWLLAILAAAGAVSLVLAALLGRTDRSPRVSLLGAATCAAVLGAGLGVAFSMPTFGFVLPVPDGVELPLVGLAVAAMGMAPLVALAVARRRGWSRTDLPALAPSSSLRFAASLGIGTLLLATWATAHEQGLPEFVDLPRMLGWPVLLLAFAGLVSLPFLSSPLANLAAGLTAATLPFVLFNPLDSEFLPHRTVVFLGLALAILAGVAAGAAARLLGQAMRSAAARWSARRKPSAAAASPARRGEPSAGSARPVLLATLPALLVTLLLGGSVYAGTPDAYEGGWYRLYNECELEAFRDIADRANADPRAMLVTGDWQAKLVLASLTNDASRVAYIGEAFSQDERRDGLVAQMEKEGRPLVLVVDRHLRAETPEADLGFLDGAPWQPAGAWCANMGVPQPRVTAHSAGGPF